MIQFPGIELSNGHVLKHVTASGALGFDGKGWPHEKPFITAGFVRPELFTNISKTVTLEPIIGNFRWYHPLLLGVGEVVQFVERMEDGSPVLTTRAFKNIGVVNAIKLTNSGIQAYTERYGRRIRPQDNLVLSFFAKTPREAEAFCVAARQCQNLKALELNAAYFGKDTEALLAVYNAVWYALRTMQWHMPLLLKLGCENEYVRVARQLGRKIEAININSVRYTDMFPHLSDPFALSGGSRVSGLVAQTVTWRIWDELSDATSVPVIHPSPTCYEDVVAIQNRGAQAIAYGSIHIPYFWRPTVYASGCRNLREYLFKKLWR